MTTTRPFAPASTNGASGAAPGAASHASLPHAAGAGVMIPHLWPPDDAQRLPMLEQPDSTLWVDEAIWGHRLHDEQSPWLCLLEFLTVFASEHAEGRAFVEDVPNRLSYTPQRQLRLRNVLFNNPHLPAIVERRLPDAAAWDEWCREMSKRAGGLGPDPSFATLRTRFDSFGDFVQVVTFLRSTAIAMATNKRWSSKYVFPFGPDALFEDLKVTDTGATSDRNFFGRTGELLYLMLARSAQASAIRAALVERFLNPDARLNRLVRALQGDPQRAPTPRGGSYLPYAALPEFEALADDWAAILARPLPGHDALPHLVAMTGLHLVLYQLRRARAVLRGAPVELLLEIVSPRRSAVRDLSADDFAEMDSLPLEAAQHYVRSVADTPEWAQALAAADPREEVRGLLAHRFLWPDPDKGEALALGPRQLLDTLAEKVRVRHAGHVGRFHGAWTRAIGLASRRASRRYRYAPTDAFLKSLVVCCVSDRMEFSDFLALLHRKYGFVIGGNEADRYVTKRKADRAIFAANATRLEDRLASLGLLRRLSDDCAFVITPFGSAESRP